MFHYIGCCMYHGISEIKCLVGGAENNILPTQNSTQNLTNIAKQTQMWDKKHICWKNHAILACFYKSLGYWITIFCFNALHHKCKTVQSELTS